MVARYLPVHNPLFLSTCPLQRSSVEAYTNELARAIEARVPGRSAEIIAVDDSSSSYAARIINAHASPVLVVQHAFSAFEHSRGAWLRNLLHEVNKPVVATLHTVPSSPSFEQRTFLRDLCERAAKVVVLSQTDRRLLRTQYFIDGDYIEVIPHGAPDVVFSSTPAAKAMLGLHGQFVVCVGPTDRPADARDALDALAEVAKQHPDVRYISFPNLHAPEAMRCLLASDAYVAVCASESQSSLAYAVAAGKPIVSTPYLYAREMLAGGRGILVPYDDASALKRALVSLIEDPAARETLAQRAYAFGRGIIWSEIARRYVDLLQSVEAENRAILA